MDITLTEYILQYQLAYGQTDMKATDSGTYSVAAKYSDYGTSAAQTITVSVKSKFRR